jgi:hypothetical protein
MTASRNEGFAHVGIEPGKMSGTRTGDDVAQRFREAALPHLDAVHTLARYLLRNPADAEQGFNIRRWSWSDLGFSAVSDIDAEELNEFGEALEAAVKIETR